jgi:hypothetical protein
VWVPISYSDLYAKELPPEELPEPPNNEYTPKYLVRQFVWNIEWLAVNEPIDPKLFQFYNLPVPDGTKVFDMRAE